MLKTCAGVANKTTHTIKRLVDDGTVPSPMINTPGDGGDDDDDDDDRGVKKQRKMQVQLEQGEFTCNSSFFDGVPTFSFDPASKSISLNVTSDASHGYLNANVYLNPLFERVGFKLACDSTTAYTAKSVLLARQLSASPSSMATTTADRAVVDETAENAIGVKDAIECELHRCVKYIGWPQSQFINAKNLSTNETTCYKFDVFKPARATPARIDLKFTCLEVENNTSISIYENAVVKRVLTIAGLGPDDAIKDLFGAAAIKEDIYETEEEPWHLIFHNSGLVKIMVKIPDDEFTDGEKIYITALRLYLVE